ncbi:MAG: transposase [Patescibacteria group bacterium]|nr:transposase [Patescibacteria group bacterium]
MTRRFKFAPGEYYHIYNRGNDRRSIFLSGKDRDRFLALLYVCNSGEVLHLSDYPQTSLLKLLSLPRSSVLADIGAYCLMPNHFHLLVRENEEGGISRLMQKLLTAYTMYFNRKHQHTGSLFEGRFRARHVSDDRHLQYLFAYIHLNPVKVRDPDNWEKKTILDTDEAVRFLNTYPYSSFLDYLGRNRGEGAIINPSAFPEYFSVPSDFSDFVQDWMSFDEEEDLTTVKVGP